LEKQKDDFQKRTESDLSSFETKEEDIGEKFKERGEADMEKFEKALLPDGVDVRPESFMEIRPGDLPEKHNIFDLSSAKKKLLEISETALNLEKKEKYEKKKTKDRYAEFDQRIADDNEKVDKRLDSDESDFEAKIKAGVDAVQDKEEKQFEKFQKTEEHDKELFRTAMGYDHDDEIAVPPEQHHMRFHDPSSFVETGANWMAPSYVRQTDDNRLSYHKVHQKKPKTLQQIEFKRKLERMRTSEQNIRKSMKQNDKRFEEEDQKIKSKADTERREAWAKLVQDWNDWEAEKAKWAEANKAELDRLEALTPQEEGDYVFEEVEVEEVVEERELVEKEA